MGDVKSEVEGEVGGEASAAGGGARRSRREKAAATRRRIREAARELFADAGYAGTTMEAIADRAGVAVQTVYFVFHTKSELLQAVLDAAVLGDGTPVPPPETAWWAAMASATDQRDAVRHLVGGVTDILARVAPLLATFAGASAEPGVTETWDRAQDLRLEGYAEVVRVLDEHHGLRDDVDRREATDVLFVLLSPGMYHQMVLERGWTPGRWADWVAALLCRELLGAS